MKKELTIGCKASKDRLSVLLGANVTGDFNLEPVLIYHTKILQPLRIMLSPLCPCSIYGATKPR